MKNKKFILGIGGFVASGKSIVGEYFAAKGALFIDSDKVVNDLYEPGKDGYLKIANFFGQEFILKNGKINRKKLAKFVFGDANKLKILNHLIHPLVASEVSKMLDATDKPVVVLEAVYFEPNCLGKIVNKILWLESSRETLLKRFLLRPGATEEIFYKILKIQSKPEKIDYLIDNNGAEQDLFLQLDKVWTEILK